MAAVGVDPGEFRRAGAQQKIKVGNRYLAVFLAFHYQHRPCWLLQKAASLKREGCQLPEKGVLLALLETIDEHSRLLDRRGDRQDFEHPDWHLCNPLHRPAIRRCRQAMRRLRR